MAQTRSSASFKDYSRRAWGELAAFPVEVNGAPGAMVTLDGRLDTVVTIEPDGARIATV